MININGVYYQLRTNEHGTYMQRMNADGTEWKDVPQQPDPTGIVIGPAPVQVFVAPAPRKSWWRRLFG